MKIHKLLRENFSAPYEPNCIYLVYESNIDTIDHRVNMYMTSSTGELKHINLRSQKPSLDLPLVMGYDSEYTCRISDYDSLGSDYEVSARVGQISIYRDKIVYKSPVYQPGLLVDVLTIGSETYIISFDVVNTRIRQPMINNTYSDITRSNFITLTVSPPVSDFDVNVEYVQWQISSNKEFTGLDVFSRNKSITALGATVAISTELPEINRPYFIRARYSETSTGATGANSAWSHYIQICRVQDNIVPGLISEVSDAWGENIEVGDNIHANHDGKFIVFQGINTNNDLTRSHLIARSSSNDASWNTWFDGYADFTDYPDEEATTGLCLSRDGRFVFTAYKKYLTKNGVKPCIVIRQYAWGVYEDIHRHVLEIPGVLETDNPSFKIKCSRDGSVLLVSISNQNRTVLGTTYTSAGIVHLFEREQDAFKWNYVTSFSNHGDIANNSNVGREIAISGDGNTIAYTDDSGALGLGSYKVYRRKQLSTTSMGPWEDTVTSTWGITGKVQFPSKLDMNEDGSLIIASHGHNDTFNMPWIHCLVKDNLEGYIEKTFDLNSTFNNPGGLSFIELGKHCIKLDQSSSRIFISSDVNTGLGSRVHVYQFQNSMEGPLTYLFTIEEPYRDHSSYIRNSQFGKDIAISDNGRKIFISAPAMNVNGIIKGKIFCYS